MLTLFVDVVLPIVAILGAGVLFARLSDVDIGTLSRFSLYVLSPPLAFAYISESSLSSGTLVQTGSFVVIYTLAMTAVVVVSCRLLRVPSTLLGPALLSTVFTNSANYGLPVLLFAYGREGFQRGVVVVVLQFILMYSLGVYFASYRQDPRAALRNVIRQPTVYAGLLGFVVALADVPLPRAAIEPIRMVGQAGVPIVLMVLGMQLANTNVRSIGRFATAATLVRLLIGPLVAALLVVVLGIGGLLGRVLIVQMAMPPAVLMGLLAVEYDARPDLVSTTILVATLVSLVTLAPLLRLLAALPL